MKSIIVLSNDEVSISQNNFSSDYNDTVNILESLDKKFNIKISSRKSKSKKNFSFKFINNLEFLDDNYLNEKTKLLVISITIRNFFNFFKLNLKKRNIIVMFC